jgi:hypothetical protein
VTLALATQATAPASLLSIAATAALSIALAAVAARVTSAPTARALHVGHRAAGHRESMTSQAEPSHPDTAGRTRARAPGLLLPAA